jgi:pimeloyl-ACP methyl ester carboxylesterase
MPSIVPFKIAIPDEKLERLKQKLALSDIPSNLDDCEPWLHGPPTSEISRLTQCWASKYDWRKAEARLNEILPQFSAKVDVDGFGTYDVHFVHHKSAREKAIPLLFVHGWPGSFIEVTKILPELVKDTAGGPAFHVVAPSLIDFGFSSPSGKVSMLDIDHRAGLTFVQKGFNIAQHAEACHKVMSALGYDQYGTLFLHFLSLS